MVPNMIALVFLLTGAMLWSTASAQSQFEVGESDDDPPASISAAARAGGFAVRPSTAATAWISAWHTSRQTTAEPPFPASFGPRYGEAFPSFRDATPMRAWQTVPPSLRPFPSDLSDSRFESGSDTSGLLPSRSSATHNPDDPLNALVAFNLHGRASIVNLPTRPQPFPRLRPTTLTLTPTTDLLQRLSSPSNRIAGNPATFMNDRLPGNAFHGDNVLPSLPSVPQLPPHLGSLTNAGAKAVMTDRSDDRVLWLGSYPVTPMFSGAGTAFTEVGTHPRGSGPPRPLRPVDLERLLTLPPGSPSISSKPGSSEP